MKVSELQEGVCQIFTRHKAAEQPPRLRTFAASANTHTFLFFPPPSSQSSYPKHIVMAIGRIREKVYRARFTCDFRFRKFSYPTSGIGARGSYRVGLRRVVWSKSEQGSPVLPGCCGVFLQQPSRYQIEIAFPRGLLHHEKPTSHIHFGTLASDDGFRF
uniref:Uncharacterized protein n=1 Tax=Vespula pensylvanica TaxID=30213 RepID=A0A834NS99_VESPE|nr:hypothetical protein H0235_011569 [Vespula pensylvanica]